MPGGDLMAASAETALAEQCISFQSLTIAHPVLSTTKDQLATAISEAPPGSIIMVFGPTGVGKTTLKLKMQQILVERERSDLETDPGRLPYVSVEALAPDKGNFSWSDHYRHQLMEMAEPMIAYKKQFPDPEVIRGSVSYSILDARAPAGQLRHALELALCHRRPTAVFIDEAQHLARVSSGRKLSDQLDVVKSLANRTRTVHVLLGTYELLAFRNLSGQLSRRCIDIHFRRYMAESREDLHIFKNVVLTFQKQLPLPEPPDLLQHWELLYERSVGCIGILKEWLMRAVNAAHKKRCPTLTQKQLEDTSLSAGQCEKIIIEAREGESRLAQGNHQVERLRSLAGLSAGSFPITRCRTEVGPPKSKARHVAKRAPKRDTVGITHLVPHCTSRGI